MSNGRIVPPTSKVNTVFPRIIAGAIISFFAPKGGDYSREAIIFRLFTGSRSQNILFYFPIKSKITSKKLNIGFLSVPNSVPWLIFIANILGVVTDSFAGSDFTSGSSSRFTAMGIDGFRTVVGGGDCSRKYVKLVKIFIIIVYFYISFTYM